MYPANFDYYRPKNLKEAISLLQKNKEAKILAGGHSLLPAMKLRVSSPPALIDISRVKGLSEIKAGTTAVNIGALSTHAAIAESAEIRNSCPILAEAAAQVGDRQVRNRGTIGGSLAHADPAADYPTVVMALQAKITATGPRGEREIEAEKFFTDLLTTALAPGEVLTSVTVPVLRPGTGGAYLKHRHPASSYAVVGVAAMVTLKDEACASARLVVGGTTPNPVVVTEAAEVLRGQKPSVEKLSLAAETVAAAITEPLGDVYASGEYRIHLATVLSERALVRAVQNARRQD